MHHILHHTTNPPFTNNNKRRSVYLKKKIVHIHLQRIKQLINYKNMKGNKII